MIVAIVGANGFIGTRLVELFHLTGRHPVVPIVRRPAALALCARFALETRLGDALAVPSLAAALAGCDAVVHTALGDPRQIEAMPAVLCAAAALARVPRVVYLSSASVHGQAPPPGTDESALLHTQHAMPYNNAKVRAERAFFRACQRHGLAGFALRPGVVYGPRSRWIADLSADLRSDQAWLLRAGDGICNGIYVDNLVAAVACCLTAPTDAAGAYLVGDAEVITWEELYHTVAVALGLDPRRIHRLATLPDFLPSTQEKIADLVAHPVTQIFLPTMPSSLKRIGKQFLAAVASSAPPPDSWQLPALPAPRVTQELALLQTCRWSLPSRLAHQRLGYTPVVDFSTALTRSLAWLAFAEGRT